MLFIYRGKDTTFFAITQISLIFCMNFIEKMVSFVARNVVKVENGTANEPSCVKRSEQTRSSIFKTIKATKVTKDNHSVTADDL